MKKLLTAFVWALPLLAAAHTEYVDTRVGTAASETRTAGLFGRNTEELGQTLPQKLDSMFTCRRYWHGNEPCHQVAWMHNYAGEPWKTQQRVRHIMDTEYLDSPGGLSGNDDAGQMSAWYVFAAIGFYPVCPASDQYMIGSPSMDEVSIDLQNGRRFTIIARNASPENIYVQSARLSDLWSSFRARCRTARRRCS